MRDQEFIDAYIGVFVDSWGCRIDHEDGSTAPFSSEAAILTEAILNNPASRIATDLALLSAVLPPSPLPPIGPIISPVEELIEERE